MTIIVKNRNGSIVLRIDRRIVAQMLTIGLAFVYIGLPL
jgi:predicted histidine transporter YuiF (NhaC family)